MKKIIRILSCVFAVIGIILVCISQMHVYSFSPAVCKLLLQKTPDEFLSVKGEDTSIENSYFFARVHKNGNLILVLTDVQKKAGNIGF